MKRSISFLVMLLLVNVCVGNTANDRKPDKQLIAKMEQSVGAFITLLSENQRREILLDLDDPLRFNWNYTPRERKGLTLKSLSSSQRVAAMGMLRLVLSQEGFLKAEQIIDLENALRVIESRPANDTYRDPENYAFLIYGKPGKGPWAWRFEGHHISLHFTIADDKIAFTPGFMGSNPGQVLADVPQKGRRILASEQDNAFALLNSLNQNQRSKAILETKAPNEIFTTNSRKVSLSAFQGLSMKEMMSQQKDLFKKLILSYLQRYHITLKNQQWTALEKAGLDQIYFAWMGDTEPIIGEGHGHYYRIHGPTFLIEFDNTQNGGNHIHSVVRDLTNDFGEDLLRLHYEKAHH